MTRSSWVHLVRLVGVLLALVLGPAALVPAGAADPLAPVNQTPPAVTGTLRVGQLLTAAPGTWLPTASSYGFTWLRDGVPIPGATAQTYRAVPADRTRQLTVRVVATGEGGSSDPVTSAPTAAIGYGLFVSSVRPGVVGTRRIERTLTAAVGSWSPAPTSYRFQWLRDDRPIVGATGRTYVTRLADFGKRLSVRVSPRRADYANGAAVSPRTGLIGHRVGVRKRYTYSIATRGPVSADLKQFAALAAQTYADPRGWRSAGYEFRRVGRGGDFTLVLATAGKLPSFGFPCSSSWSCRVGRYVIINQTRWQRASPAWNAKGLRLRDYRHMVVNHETGHWLGHGHSSCRGKGRKAPVMMQQSKGLNGCRFNPFPLPSERWTRR